jgi:hypothetical protein
MQKIGQHILQLNMTIYTPFESPCRVDTILFFEIIEK